MGNKSSYISISVGQRYILDQYRKILKSYGKTIAFAGRKKGKAMYVVTNKKGKTGKARSINSIIKSITKEGRNEE